MIKYLKKLKILFHSNIFYFLLFLFLIIYIFLSINKKDFYKTDLNSNKFEGIIVSYKIKNDLLTLEVKGIDKIVCFYYFNDDVNKNNFINNYNLGDRILLSGSFSVPNNNTIPNLFNYKKYLKSKGIYIVMNCDSFYKLSNNKNIIYMVKNIINKHINSYKSKAYLSTFIMGDKSMLDGDIYERYQNNGVSHLLAISGMHISILSGFILMLLKKININNNISYFIVILFLFIYMMIIGITPSVLRCILLFLFIYLNKKYNLNISLIKIFLLVLFLVLLINPFYIYNTSFLYSFIVSFYLVLFKNKFNNDNYFYNLFLVSFISFCVSLPVTFYYFYEINFLSIIMNLIFVPIISLVVFPIALITFFIPFLDNILLVLINIIEFLSFLFSKITFFNFIFGRPNYIFIIFYYLFITIFLYTNRKKYFVLILILLFVLYNRNYFFSNTFILTIDVGQGDSILIHNRNKNILIDTGGKVNYKNNSSIALKKNIPLFKSFGIRNIDYLILSHGDYDHMGEAINLVNNFKVEKVIFNCGEFNDLEKNLIKLLDKKTIQYYSCIKELNVDKNKLFFLQTKEYDNENDNSNVIYTELDGYKFMLMGDASITTEKEIISKYNLPDIDVLKVGHHGSKTSSSKEFLDEINPKYFVISVGKNNRYGHPNKEVLDNLNDSKVYRTDQDGSITFKIKNRKLEIETCSP